MSRDVYPLPIRYNDKDNNGYCKALMPSQCRRGCNYKGVFKCLSGEKVKVEWLGVFINDHDASVEQLNHICETLYDWTFERVKSNWVARLGIHTILEDCWDYIRIRKYEGDTL